jgi:hypothetical protein
MAAVDAAAASLPARAPDGYFEALPSRILARLGAAPKAPVRTRRLPAWTWAAAAALLLAVVAPLTLRRPAPDSVPAVPAPAGAPELTLGDREQKRERDALAAPGAPPTPAARPRPALDSRPAAAVAAAPAGGLGKGKAESEAARGPLAAPAGAAERATPRSKRADAQTQSAVRDEPAPLTTDVLAALESAQASARRAPAASASVESSARPNEVTGGAPSVPQPGIPFGELETSRPRTVTEWRRVRDAWSAFAAAHTADPRADEARVRAIEAGRAAWLAGGNDDDRAAFLLDARAYLEREDARQKGRVERLLPLPSRQP